MVSFRGPKKVGPHPDWSQGFNSKLLPSICTPPLSYGSPNLTTSAHSFFYTRNVQVFSIFKYPTMHSVCPPHPSLFLYKLLLSNAPGRTPYSREHWKTISYTEFKANRPRVYYGGFAWGKNENLDLNIKDQRDIRILWRKPWSSNTHFIQQNDTYYKIKGIKIILQTLSSYSSFE